MRSVPRQQTAMLPFYLKTVLPTLTQTLIELLVEVQKTGFTRGPFILFQRSNLNSPLKTSFHFSLISGFLKCFPHFCLSHLFFNLLIQFFPFLVISFSFSQFTVTQIISSTVITYLHYQLVNKSQLERGHPKKGFICYSEGQLQCLVQLS